MISRSFALAAIIVALAVAAGSAFARSSRHGGAGDDISSGGRTDGVWTFEASTTAGSCPSLLPRDITIRGGHVVAANGGSSEPWGYVEGNGTFVARITDQNGHVARVVGKLSSGSGKGAWSSSSDYCGGRWRASRTAGR